MRTTSILCRVVTILSLLAVNLAWGAAEDVLHRFGNANPGGLVFDHAGNLYGTSFDPRDGSHDSGSVFELSPVSGGWKHTFLYRFKGGKDGTEPSQSETLIFDAQGNLYGTTILGGAHGVGCIFKLTPKSGGGWTESAIYSFDGKPAGYPENGVIFDSVGNLYGTTYESYKCGSKTCVGTAFQLSPASGGSWTIQILHQFGMEPNDGIGPLAALAFDPTGNLIGTTYQGGVPNCGYFQTGCGTVFQLAPASGGGWNYSVLHRFKGNGDGERPYAGVVSDVAGNIYGVTAFGGKPGINCSGVPNCGTVFQLSPNSDGTWTNTVLHKFASYPKDGAVPMGGVAVDQAGHVFGTTMLGGPSQRGTVFELTKQSTGWQETTLYNFKGKEDGVSPYAGVMLDTEGNVYGTTLGTSDLVGLGVAFKITP